MINKILTLGHTDILNDIMITLLLVYIIHCDGYLCQYNGCIFLHPFKVYLSKQKMNKSHDRPLPKEFRTTFVIDVSHLSGEIFFI